MRTKIKNNWFNNLFFSGAEVLYPLLSFVCLFFFFAFFSRNVGYTVLDGKSPSWLSWYIFAVLGYAFCSLWGIIRQWWNPRFLAIGMSIIFFSFFSIQTYLYHLPQDKVSLAMFSICILGGCLVRIFKSPFVGKILWALPLLVIGIYYLIGNILFVILSCIVSLVILAIFDTIPKLKIVKICVAIGVSLFYIVTTWAYFPYNPMLLGRNIKSISMSYQPKIVSLVVEQNGKYVIVDGTSITGSSPVDIKFDCWQDFDSVGGAFVGFKTDKFKKFENSSLLQNTSNIFPSILSDSCVYFTSRIDIYKNLDNFKTSNDRTIRLTALILDDFMELYQVNDSINLNKLKKHQKDLQNELEKVTIDSLSFMTDTFNCNKILKDFSRNMSLGMLNALCSDLVMNNDINCALNIFSWQFLLTYINTDIYNYINTNVTANIEKTSNGVTERKTVEVSSKGLKRMDAFEPWVKMVLITKSFAETYIVENRAKDYEKACSILYGIIENNMPSKSILDKKSTLEVKAQIEDIQSVLSSYESTPTIKQYVTTVQKFLYQCVLRNYMPDYNSFFLNRFNEITPLVPMNPESILAYERMSDLYSNRFKQEIQDVQESRKMIDKMFAVLDERILMQEKIEELVECCSDPQLRESIKKFINQLPTVEK